MIDQQNFPRGAPNDCEIKQGSRVTHKVSELAFFCRTKQGSRDKNYCNIFIVVLISINTVRLLLSCWEVNLRPFDCKNYIFVMKNCDIFLISFLLKTWIVCPCWNKDVLGFRAKIRNVIPP